MWQKTQHENEMQWQHHCSHSNQRILAGAGFQERWNITASITQKHTRAVLSTKFVLECQSLIQLHKRLKNLTSIQVVVRILTVSVKKAQKFMTKIPAKTSLRHKTYQYYQQLNQNKLHFFWYFTLKYTAAIL